MPPATRTISYADQRTALTGFLAWDDAAQPPLPGLLLVHGGAGVVSTHGSLATTAPAQPGTVAAKVLVCHGAVRGIGS